MTDGLRLIGLTGGIGSGKSTVARLIAQHGIPIVDADQLAREVVAQPGSPALVEIAAAWPSVVGADGHLDRRKLAATVFSDPGARARLEAIMHPRIVARARQRVSELAASGHTLVFYEASLLVETERYRELDGLVVVDAPVETRVARVVARDHVTPAEVRARIAAQLPMSAKRAVATAVIENDGDMARLSQEVTELLKTLVAEPKPKV